MGDINVPHTKLRYNASTNSPLRALCRDPEQIVMRGSNHTGLMVCSIGVLLSAGGLAVGVWQGEPLVWFAIGSFFASWFLLVGGVLTLMLHLSRSSVVLNIAAQTCVVRCANERFVERLDELVALQLVKWSEPRPSSSRRSLFLQLNGVFAPGEGELQRLHLMTRSGRGRESLAEQAREMAEALEVPLLEES